MEKPVRRVGSWGEGNLNLARKALQTIPQTTYKMCRLQSWEMGESECKPWPITSPLPPTLKSRYNLYVAHGELT